MNLLSVTMFTIGAVLLCSCSAASTAHVASARVPSHPTPLDDTVANPAQLDDFFSSSFERSMLSTGAGVRTVELWVQQHADGGLPAKPESLGPDSASWSNSIAICSLIKDEISTDVREWVLYFRCAERSRAQRYRWIANQQRALATIFCCRSSLRAPPETSLSRTETAEIYT